MPIKNAKALRKQNYFYPFFINLFGYRKIIIYNNKNVSNIVHSIRFDSKIEVSFHPSVRVTRIVFDSHPSCKMHL